MNHTPWLNIKSDDTLGGRLHLALLLLLVLGQSLLPDSGSLSILLLIVTAKEVDILVFFLSLLGGLGGVDGDLADVWAVGLEGLGWVARQGRELGLIRGDVLVPASSVWVSLDSWGGAESLEDLDVGLRRSRAIFLLALS